MNSRVNNTRKAWQTTTATILPQQSPAPHHVSFSHVKTKQTPPYHLFFPSLSISLPKPCNQIPKPPFSFLSLRKQPESNQSRFCTFFISSPKSEAMEAAHVISRPVCRYSDAKSNVFSSKLFVGRETSRVSFRARSCGGVSNHGFVDSGHLRYYVASTRCGEKKEKILDMKTEKQRLKLIKRLSKDLSVYSSGVGCDEKIKIGDGKEKLISEATEVLLAELEQLKSEQKEQKRKRKEVKVQQKAAIMGAKVAKCDSESSSSSSSSESSDSDCEEVVPMSCLTSDALMKPTMKGATALAEPISPIQEVVPRTKVEPSSLVMEERMRSVLEKTDSGVRSPGEGCNANGINGVAVEANGKKVEVCMGGKCKKLGAVALLEEFEREVGWEADVVGCKCMGKCKTAPNVKVLNCSGEDQETSAEGSVRPVTNPLCIAVGLEDVSVIVANLLGKDKNGGYLMAPS